MDDGGKTSEEDDEIRINIEEIGLDDIFTSEIITPIDPSPTLPPPKTPPMNPPLNQPQTPINTAPTTNGPSTPTPSTSPSTPKSSGRPKKPHMEVDRDAISDFIAGVLSNKIEEVDLLLIELDCSNLKKYSSEQWQQNLNEKGILVLLIRGDEIQFFTTLSNLLGGMNFFHYQSFIVKPSKLVSYSIFFFIIINLNL